MDPAYPARAYSSTTNGEAWIIVLLAALVVMLACVIVTVVYLKRKQTAGKQLGHFNGKYCDQSPPSFLIPFFFFFYIKKYVIREGTIS